jgi:hypothetical protein
MIKRTAILAAMTLAVALGASSAYAAPVTIDFGGSVDQPVFRSFTFDASADVGSGQVAVDGVSADFVQLQPAAAVDEAVALPNSFDLGAGFSQAFIGANSGWVGQSTGAKATSSNGNFFDASSALDVGSGAGFMAASGNLDGVSFSGFNVGVLVLVPLPPSAAMGLGLLAAIGGLSAWRRRRRASEIA